MIRTMVNKSCRALAVSAVAVMSLCGPAKAAEFVVNWDPLFGGGLGAAVGIANLGWKGESAVSVDPSCLSNVGAPASRVIGIDCAGPATVTSLFVQFWSGSVATPVFPTMVATSLPTVLAIDVAVDGPDADLLAEVVGTDGSGFSLVKSGFVLGTGTFNVYVDLIGGAFAGIQLRLDRTDICCEIQYFSGVDNEFAPIVTWRTPEPTTLALIGAALLGMRLRRRS